MEGVLDGDHWRTAQLVDTLQYAADIEFEMKIVSMLKLEPKLISKNDYETDVKYIFEWGNLSGLGDSVSEAVRDFNNSYYNSNKKK